MLTCRYSQPGTSANRVGMYEYISHSFMSTFTLKPLQSMSPVHCMPHWATSGKPPTPVRLTTLVGSSTAHVHFSSGIVSTGMNDFGKLPDDMPTINKVQNAHLYRILRWARHTFRLHAAKSCLATFWRFTKELPSIYAHVHVVQDNRDCQSYPEATFRRVLFNVSEIFIQFSVVIMVLLSCRFVAVFLSSSGLFF